MSVGIATRATIAAADVWGIEQTLQRRQIVLQDRAVLDHSASRQLVDAGKIEVLGHKDRDLTALRLGQGWWNVDGGFKGYACRVRGQLLGLARPILVCVARVAIDQTQEKGGAETIPKMSIDHAVKASATKGVGGG